MTYKMFLDDIRSPDWVYPNCDIDWVVCRNYHDAVGVFATRGWPDYVSFDHDLGESDDQTGYDFAQFLVERDLECKGMPANFAFVVHSANPVGAANIKGLLDGYLKFRGK